MTIEEKAKEIADKEWHPHITPQGWAEAAAVAMAKYMHEQDGWQKIETMPKDGTKAVVGHPDYDAFPVASWQWVRGVDNNDNDGNFLMLVSEDEHFWEDGTLWPDLGYIEPTHWQPLPSPPTS